MFSVIARLFKFSSFASAWQKLYDGGMKGLPRSCVAGGDNGEYKAGLGNCSYKHPYSADLAEITGHTATKGLFKGCTLHSPCN